MNVALSFERMFFGPPKLRFQQTRFFFIFVLHKIYITVNIPVYIQALLSEYCFSFSARQSFVFSKRYLILIFVENTIYTSIFTGSFERMLLFFWARQSFVFDTFFFLKYQDSTHSHRKSMGLLRSCHEILRSIIGLFCKRAL